MEKVKMNIPNEMFDEWFSAGEIFGQTVMVRKKISYEEMVSFATEYAQHCCVIDEKAQVAYQANEKDKVMCYLTLKYYSNIDIDDQEDPMIFAANIMCFIDNFFVHTNVFDAMRLAERFMENTIEIYSRYHSLSTKIISSFGGLLNSGDLIKQLSESREISEPIVDFLQERSKMNDENQIFKQFAKKPE